METYSALIIRHGNPATAPQVFLTPVGDAWRLPPFTPRNDIYNIDAEAANRLVQEQLGISVVTRQALRLVGRAPSGPLNIYVMEMRRDENRQSPTIPGNWFGWEVVQEVSLTLPKERAVLREWFAAAHGEGAPSLGIPWWQVGWFEATAGWLQAQVTRLDRTVLAPVEQMRNTYTSAILRVLTNEGYLYLKVVPAVFAHEPALTRMLAQRDSAHFPTVLAAGEDYMLMRDIGDRQPLGGNVSLARWEEIIRYYGEAQASSANSVEQWLSLGCADLRTDRLAARLEELLAHVPERLRGLPQQLSAEETARLRALAAPLKTLCMELADYGIPDALEHGDLHAGNVALSEKGFLLYDWSHSCVTYPFYGFGSLLLDDDWFPERPETTLRLRDAYLEAWTGYVPMTQLRAAFTLWSRLRPLFAAAHQSYVVAAYQEMLQGRDYAAETATGNALQHMQWWLANHWRGLFRSFEE